MRRSFSHAVRSFRSAPGFVVLVVFTLGLGIGATTAVFSIVHSILLKPLPYADSGRLVALFESAVPDDVSRIEGVSPGNFLDWQNQNAALAGIAASCGFSFNVTAPGMPPEHVNGAAVSANYFQVLGTSAAIGRTFSPYDDRHAAPHVVILSHDLWVRRFGGDKGILGKTVPINGDAYSVIGILPANWSWADGDDDYQLWIPLQQQIMPERMLWRNQRFLRVVARLRPGITPQQAGADLNRISASIKQANPGEDIDSGVVVVNLHEALVRDSRPGLMLALGIAGIVLLIACANVSNLMLVRMSVRAREMAIRIALGASPGQIVVESLVESLLLAIAAGAAGVALAIGGKRILLTMIPWHARDFAPVNVDLLFLTAAFGISVLTGILFGVLPAFAATRPRLQGIFGSSNRSFTADRSGRRWRNVLVVAEISLAVVLLIGTGLLLRSINSLEKVPLGFHADDVIGVRISLPRIKYQQDRDVVAFAENVERALKALPQVERASLIEHIPLQNGPFRTSFQLPGVLTAGQFEVAALRLIRPGYFSTISIPLLKGRDFTDHDETDSEQVAIISAAVARKYWPNQDPIGKVLVPTRLDVRGGRSSRVIVGVVGDVRDSINLEPLPTVYLPFTQMSFPTMVVLLKTRASVQEILPLATKAISSIDPQQPVSSVFPLSALLEDELEPWRYAVLLMGGLAMIAMTLTLVGLFAVVSYAVREQTKEIGIRIAIGAAPTRVLAAMLRKGVVLTIAGVALGCSVSLASTQLLQTMIFGISRNDPLTFAVVAALLIFTAAIASYIPARRAAAVDPMTVLRQE